MSYSSPNPDQRIDSAVESLKSCSSTLSPEAIVLESNRRGSRSHRTIVKLSFAAACSTAVVATALVAMWPHPALASIDDVIKATQSRVLFEQILTVRFEYFGNVTHTSHRRWQLRDRIVQTTYEGFKDGENPETAFPSDPRITKTNTWTFPNGDFVGADSRMPRALRRHDAPRKFDDFPTLSKLFAMSKVVQTTQSVHAHGGVFDRYLMEWKITPQGVARFAVFVEPSTHLIRFTESAKYVGKGNPPSFLLPGNDRLWEYRYPDEAVMESEAPKLPSEDQIDDTVDIKKRFLRDTQSPVGTQVVSGVSKSLYTVVIMGGGWMAAVTKGGDPRDPTDPHGIQIVDPKLTSGGKRPGSVGKLLALVSTGKRNIAFEGTKRIGDDEFVVESIDGNFSPMFPRQITLRVPVWKYDRAHPIKTGKDAEVREVYHSKFLGYATFTTNRIYVMPGVVATNWGGEQLPSDYQIGTRQGKIQLKR